MTVWNCDDYLLLRVFDLVDFRLITDASAKIDPFIPLSYRL